MKRRWCSRAANSIRTYLLSGGVAKFHEHRSGFVSQALEGLRDRLRRQLTADAITSHRIDENTHVNQSASGVNGLCL